MKQKFILIFFICISIGFAQLDKFGGELIYSEEQHPENYDPFLAGDNMASLRISQLIFETLVIEDEYGEVVPQLAQSWNVINDKTIRFRLRDNVKWHDNTEFSADDIVFTINALKNPNTRAITYYKKLASKIEYVESQGGSVEIKLNSTVADLPKFFSKIFIYPSHLFKNNVIDGRVFFNNRPIGTGPFQFHKVDAGGGKKRLRKNQYYYKDVYLDKVTSSVQMDPDLSVQELKLGGSNMKVTVPNKDVGPLEATGEFKIYPYSSLKIDVVAMNFNNELLRNKFIRKAMVYALDRQKLLDTYYFGYGQLISGPFAPNSVAYNPNIAPIRYDEYQAALQLNKFGCIDSDNDGILEYEKKSLEFNLLVPVAQNNATAIKLADAIKDQLSRVGIKINVIRLEYNSFIQRTVLQKEFDLALFSIAFDENANISPLFYQNAEKNFISYNNGQVNQLLDAASQTNDNEKKRTIFYQLHQILAEDCPYIFLWTLKSNAVYHKKLRRVTIDPFKFFQAIDKWYIDSDFR